MRATLAIAGDLLREAARRRWFLALGIGVTAVLALLALSLRLDVVDGALAATRFFGKALGNDIRSVDVVMRHVYAGAAYFIFYGGLIFFVIACADFAPSLFAPGRIEHLLALPVRRVELLAGTLLGVLALASCAAAYGAGGLALILGVKTGYWTLRPVAAALLAAVTFTALYAAMLAAALFVRSAAISAAVGLGLFFGGIVAGNRAALSAFMSPGWGRRAFEALTLLLPRVSQLADAGAGIAAANPGATARVGTLCAGMALFALGVLCLAAMRLERKDF